MQAFARPARRRQREEVPVAARQSSSREHVAELRLEEDTHEALQDGTDRAGGIGVAGEEALLECAVARQGAASGHTERDDVTRTVEAIPEAHKRLTVARRVEAGDELRRRWAHLVEHALELPAEEIDASIGQTRGQQRDDFSVARIRITERKSDGVALDPGGVVEVAVELLERFAQCAGSSHSPLTRMITCSAVAKLRDVGVCGLGVIGCAVCRALDGGIPGLRLGGAMTRSRAAGEAFLATLQSAPPFLPLEDLIATCDLIVEASTQSHLAEVAPKVLQAGRDLVVLSAGGLLGRGDWVALAEANRCRIYVPSGAIAGLDGVKGASVGAVTSVTMETRKPPRGLAGAPWIVQQKIDLDAITKETLIFEGPATEACRAFPANVNVVAALSLAGVGPERTRIKIYAVPGLGRNQHRVTIEGEFGRLSVELENVPSENPKTGKLSYLSTIALLRQLGAPLVVGT